MAGTFTPSNLYTISMGSVNLSIAQVGRNIHNSGTSFWTSKIPAIISVIGNNNSGGVPSESGLMVSFTQTNGVIWIQRALGMSSSSLTLWIAHGGYGQDVWETP